LAHIQPIFSEGTRIWYKWWGCPKQLVKHFAYTTRVTDQKPSHHHRIQQSYIRMFNLIQSSIIFPLFSPPLLGDTDNTASRTGASVASLLALLVLALAEVVGAGVDDDGAAEHALRADQLDELVRDAALGVALGVGLEVAQVADVALAVRRGAVRLVVGVDWVGRKRVSTCIMNDAVDIRFCWVEAETRLDSMERIRNLQ
jgi:hypothetical protein